MFKQQLSVISSVIVENMMKRHEICSLSDSKLACTVVQRKLGKPSEAETRTGVYL